MREKINLNGVKRVHFIGIGGISMSGLAELLQRDGFHVSGSDDTETEITAHLREIGIRIAIPNSAENITSDMQLVIFTAAVKPDNPEYQAAQELGIELIERAVFIGRILTGYEPICVAGSHGKTTTTSMISEILLKAGLDPTISIGGHMMGVGGVNYRVGSSKHFVLEACEYSNSFHHWRPQIGVILNIDADHLDFFGSMENLILAFVKFASNIRPEGALIIREGIQGYEQITNACSCEVITVGDCGRFAAKKVTYREGKPSFDILDNGEKIARVSLPLLGEYNMLNALSAFAVGVLLKIPAVVIADALNGVSGTKRRFEHKGVYNGVQIVDDYAHHPTEILACLRAARQYARGSVFCLFQPHTYTRTRNLLDEFSQAFTDADYVVLLPIYAAREPFDPLISSEILAERVKKNGNEVKYVDNFHEACNYLREQLKQGDLLITMGAGDVYKVGDKLLSEKLST